MSLQGARLNGGVQIE